MLVAPPCAASQRKDGCVTRGGGQDACVAAPQSPNPNWWRATAAAPAATAMAVPATLAMVGLAAGPGAAFGTGAMSFRIALMCMSSSWRLATARPLCSRTVGAIAHASSRAGLSSKAAAAKGEGGGGRTCAGAWHHVRATSTACARARAGRPRARHSSSPAAHVHERTSLARMDAGLRRGASRGAALGLV